MFKLPKQSNLTKQKPHNEAHVAKTEYGMGDHYGTGIRNPMGRMRDGMGMKEITPRKLKTPPKSVV